MKESFVANLEDRPEKEMSGTNCTLNRTDLVQNLFFMVMKYKSISVLIRRNQSYQWLLKEFCVNQEAMNQGPYTGTIFLDPCKAFDVVNHDWLIAKLKMYGYSTSSLLWFKSYLTGCRQCVSLTATPFEENFANKQF
ncbi:uncharacterized protein LOC141896835 isoform X2 [Acropora palmata]|uniref:uncharacterized protein LOC141896835 isoform X2 n=1 Tax=Acropora palmata TaxID=6131 RepID=UPI003DA11A8A